MSNFLTESFLFSFCLKSTCLIENSLALDGRRTAPSRKMIASSDNIKHMELPHIISKLPDDDDDDKETEEHLNDEIRRKYMEKMHWIIHFDINETILVGDEVGGDTTDDCYNKILAKSAFCRMPTADSTAKYDYDSTSALRPTHWWDGTPIMLLEPEKDDRRKDQPITRHIPPLFTGWHWPKGCCPYYRTIYKERSKTFVKHHGAIYQPMYNKIVEQLAFEESRTNPEFRNILPAFFHTIYNLVHKQGKEHRPQLSIVFRTFGTDLPNIAQAMTAFAQGKHPHYPDFVHPEYELNVSQLYNARWTSVKDTATFNDNATEQHYQYQLYRLDDGTLAASGDRRVLDLFHDTSRKGYVYGIRDDYPMWKCHNWEPWAGKPVWITESTHHHHILFDDNIHNLPHDGIASVRRQVASPSNDLSLPSSLQNHTISTDKHSTGVFESLSGPEIQAMQGLHLVRVPTIEPILNINWFLEQIRKVQTAAISVRDKRSHLEM